jgi:hypothetical protein
MKPTSMRSSESNNNLKSLKQTQLGNLIPLEEENFFEEVDKDQLDRTIQQIQEERFFKKEFAKDLKKFKLAENIDERPKRAGKKTDLIDSFIEGDIKLDEILSKMNEEKRSHKHGGAAHAAAVKDNKKITEMF